MKHLSVGIITLLAAVVVGLIGGSMNWVAHPSNDLGFHIGRALGAGGTIALFGAAGGSLAEREHRL